MRLKKNQTPPLMTLMKREKRRKTIVEDVVKIEL
jgi:hypothetical protein